jgi:hypothetical protein
MKILGIIDILNLKWMEVIEWETLRNGGRRRSISTNIKN